MTNYESHQCEEEKRYVSGFFKGKSVFVTGATGFMGKVLIEKLLRCCPDIGNVYVLVREKRKNPYERIKDLTAIPLFDVVKKQRPEAIEKLKPVKGDVTELGLGLSDEDRDLLVREVSVVFHAAASVRFDDSLAYAIILNVRGTRETINLAMEMKNLKVFVHVSTAYCNLHETVVEEKLYPAPADWRDMISIAENTEDLTLRILTPKILGTYPNTYTFSKGLAEHLVNDHSDKLPSVIIRPTILISTAEEPFPGWGDTFNGPVGLLIAASMGVVHVSYSRRSCVADYMPVDIAVSATILAAWKKGTESSSKEVSIYQCSSHKHQALTLKEVVDIGQSLIWDYPLGYCLWYPSGIITDNWFIYFIAAMLFHIVPAVFFDLLLRIAGKKPILLKIARRIYLANTALSHFMLNEWQFSNEKTLELEKYLCGSDIQTFSYHTDEIDHMKFFRNGLVGARKYLLKRSEDSLESERRHLKRMYVLALLTNSLFAGLILWYIYTKFIA
ncbi:putative fatty acyl-CoA reductase CG5065 [Schistocerca gregaria]|uniref:putative fatty acyl-CoA reductase CG5065 n=1 Tax=Schistocerca gregaria TaxID=7010 RepID=UPI00211E8DA4|nr:putative fatty acyl-CoA reductase CG5065 [Schistocerca gregaria]